MKCRILLAPLVVGLMSMVAWAQSLVGLRIDGPGEMVEDTVTMYHVIAEFDNGWEYEVTLSSHLWVEPGDHAEIGVFGDFHAYEVDGDEIETINAFYAFGGDAEVTTLDVTILNVPPAGYALDFDGVDDIVMVPGSGSLAYPGSGGWTIEAWVYPRNAYPSLETPVAGQLSMGLVARDPYSIEIADGMVRFRVDNAFGASQRVEAPIAENEWTHVAGVYDLDGGTLALYVNGAEVGWEPISVVMESNSSYTVLFGGQGDGPGQYDGMIDEVRIWQAARSYCQIKGYMQRPLQGDEPTLMGYWRCDEAEGQDVLDSAPFGNHGALGSTGAPEDNDPAWVFSYADLSLGPFSSVGWTTPELIPEVSSGHDWMVSVSGNGLEMYISSERDGFAENDIYRAERPGVDDLFSTPTVVSELSVPGYNNHDAWPALSGDGLRIYFARHYGHGPGDLYVAERASTASPWGAPASIDSLNTTDSELAPALTADELYMVFVSDRSGQKRYWTASRDSVTSPWDNLALIDSLAGFEARGCTLTGDGLTLYVAAEGPTGLGDKDIWKLTRPSTTSPFGQPVHIPELSSPQMDGAVWISGDASTVYLASQRNGGPGNIYLAEFAIPGGPVPGELDCDGDVDLDDLQLFTDCLTGPAGNVPSGCRCADYDADDDVDMDDFAEFAVYFTGSI